MKLRATCFLPLLVVVGTLTQHATGMLADDSCMAKLLLSSGLNATHARHASELLHHHGLDQETFATADYSAASGLLRDIGINTPVDVFYIYTALHNADGATSPCAAGSCVHTSAGFSCQQKSETHQPTDMRTGAFADVIKELQNKLDELMQAQAKPNEATAAYTRWGRQDCPTGASLVYSGMSAGAYHADLGSGVNLQCLTGTPVYGRFSDYQWGGIIYPALYKFQEQNEPYASHYTNGYAPCAVCEVNGKTSTITVPARSTCPVGWSLEYAGYLLSSNFNVDRRSMFLCFDEDIQSLGEVANSTSSHNLYVVGVDCRNDAHCPPYYNARELTCAVCSK